MAETQQWSFLLCDCVAAQDASDTTNVLFEGFVKKCSAHVAAITANPAAVYVAIVREDEVHRVAINAIIDKELDTQWPGETQAKLTAAIQKKITDGEISEPVELMVVDPALALKQVRYNVLLNSLSTESTDEEPAGFKMNADRTETFTVKNQKATTAELNAAVSAATGDNSVNTVDAKTRL